MRELGVRALGGGDALSPESLAGFELAADLRAFLAVPPSVLARFALPARSCECQSRVQQVSEWRTWSFCAAGMRLRRVIVGFFRLTGRCWPCS